MDSMKGKNAIEQVKIHVEWTTKHSQLTDADKPSEPVRKTAVSHLLGHIFESDNPGCSSHSTQAASYKVFFQISEPLVA